MVEINGWIMIRESYKEKDDNDELLHSIIKQIDLKINKLSYINEFYVSKRLNGSHHLSIMVNHNHRSSAKHVIDFFRWIAEISIGSYGILYVHDDEDLRRQNENKFKVWVMKKGVVTEEDDIFLSPLIPTIES